MDRAEEGPQLLLLVDEFDRQRQVAGKIEDARALDVAVDAEADDAAQNRRAGDLLIARVLDDRVVERAVNLSSPLAFSSV